MALRVDKIIEFIIGKDEFVKTDRNAFGKFKAKLRVARKCRYNTSDRIKNIGVFSFFTTTALSLGLIFIPLMQNADIEMHFRPKVLNMIQIFWAVSVLVYSVINSKARYEVRSRYLNECGDKIQDLCTELELAYSRCTDKDNFDLSIYQKRYGDIKVDVEDHTQVDFYITKLNMRDVYRVTGLNRIYLVVKAYVMLYFGYIIPASMLFTEAMVITDMLGVTDLFCHYFNTSI